MGLNELVRSKPYKNFMAKLYGIGAAVVIAGALFKILAWPFANEMLMVGMLTECVIFAFSAFEPLHVEYNWSLVYPELKMGQDYEEPKSKKNRGNLTATQQLDNMLQEAKIGPDLIESLASGMRNLGENANKLAGVTDAAVVTDSYISNVSKASESVRTLVSSYDRTADALNKDLDVTEQYLSNVNRAANAVNQLANVYETTVNSIETDNSSYNNQLQKLSNNLSAINAIYELQLQDSQEYSKLTDLIQNSIGRVAEGLNESVENTLKYKEQVDALTKNVSMLNTIYGNMLSAMNVSK